MAAAAAAVVVVRGAGGSDAQLRRQVELLQRDIEQHVATETMLQNISVQLRQRLELFQRRTATTWSARV